MFFKLLKTNFSFFFIFKPKNDTGILIILYAADKKTYWFSFSPSLSLPKKKHCFSFFVLDNDVNNFPVHIFLSISGRIFQISIFCFDNLFYRQVEFLRELKIPFIMSRHGHDRASTIIW